MGSFFNADENGLQIANLTTVQRNAISNPPKGLLIFNTDDNEYQFNSGTAGSPVWSSFATGSSGLSLGGAQVETLEPTMAQSFITINNEQAVAMPVGVIGDATISTFEIILRNNFLNVGSTVDLEIGLYDDSLNQVGNIGSLTIADTDTVDFYTASVTPFVAAAGQYFLAVWKDTSTTGGDIQLGGLFNALGDIQINFEDNALAAGLPATLTRDAVNTDVPYIGAR